MKTFCSTAMERILIIRTNIKISVNNIFILSSLASHPLCDNVAQRFAERCLEEKRERTTVLEGNAGMFPKRF